MNYKIFTIVILISFNIIGFANNQNDTIKVKIDLTQLDSNGLKVMVYLPKNISGFENYLFPKSIPGLYEYLTNQTTRTGFYLNGKDTMALKSIDNYIYPIDCSSPNKILTYYVTSSVSRFRGIYGEDMYYHIDSLYILNWHYLIGFFKNHLDAPYKITILKNAQLWGAGSLCKNMLNDTTDVFVASTYKDIINNPIMYSIPDTISFTVGKSKFTISCAGNDTLLDSKKIRDLLIAPLAEILKKSEYKHDNFTFMYYSEYSLTAPYLTGLEHPNSTLICYHSALLDNNILIGSSIHEFIHAIYAPLRIRSEVINDFDFIAPKCDKLLWFYEGVTEYLSIKTLLSSSVFSNTDFLNELNESNSYHKNINFNKVSSNIYGKKGQNLFDNFYTSGSLFALQLDIEIRKLSNGKTNLFDVMRELQKLYNPNKPFDSNNFIKEFSLLSGVSIQDFISRFTDKKTKIDFFENINTIGYSPQKRDTLVYSFDSKKGYFTVNYKLNRLEYTMIGSIINKEQNCKKLTIYELDNKSLNWFNYEGLLSLKSGRELQLRAFDGKKDLLIVSKPILISKKSKQVSWKKNENFQTELSKNFWNE